MTRLDADLHIEAARVAGIGTDNPYADRLGFDAAGRLQQGGPTPTVPLAYGKRWRGWRTRGPKSPVVVRHVEGHTDA